MYEYNKKIDVKFCFVLRNELFLRFSKNIKVVERLATFYCVWETLQENRTV